MLHSRSRNVDEVSERHRPRVDTGPVTDDLFHTIADLLATNLIIRSMPEQVVNLMKLEVIVFETSLIFNFLEHRLV